MKDLWTQYVTLKLPFRFERPLDLVILKQQLFLRFDKVPLLLLIHSTFHFARPGPLYFSEFFTIHFYSFSEVCFASHLLANVMNTNIIIAITHYMTLHAAITCYTSSKTKLKDIDNENSAK